MHLPNWQLRYTQAILFIILFCAGLWTAYLLFASDHAFSLGHSKLPSSQGNGHAMKGAEDHPSKVVGGGGWHPAPVGKAKGSKAAFDDAHAQIDVVVPPGVRVIALVFFGRRRYVQIMDCYLQRNLKDQGGLLDEVVFAIRTENKDDLAYLEELLLTNPHYKKHIPNKENEGWLGSWEVVTEPDSIYVKIDDDVVYFEDTTIPSVVKRLLENRQYFAVSANVVNNPALAWVHYHMGVYQPYWPELSPPASIPAPSWRASELPPYKGPPNGPPDFEIDGKTPAPYKGHRWLPVHLPEGDYHNISNFPASTLSYNPFGPSLHNWAAAAQTHYSFLHHLEQKDTWRYKFETWDYNYMRLSINFFAIRGSDILDVFPFPQSDDEDYLTIVRPKQLRRRVVVDGIGLAVHFAFGPQYYAHEGKAVEWTDALSRYKEYAKERICLPPTTTRPRRSSQRPDH